MNSSKTDYKQPTFRTADRDWNEPSTKEKTEMARQFPIKSRTLLTLGALSALVLATASGC